MIDTALASWRERGFAVLPGAAPQNTVRALRERLEDLIAGRELDPGLFFQRDAASGDYADVTFGHGYEGPDVAYRKIEKLERDPLFAGWIANPLFLAIADAALAPPPRLYRATVFRKAAHTGSETPWHQDGGLFWGLDRHPSVQLWTALDDADEASGCLWVVPGSHHAGLATPMGGRVPPHLLGDADARAVPLPARAGDVVLLHNLAWHRSGANRSDAPRRALTVSLLDGRTRCTRKKRAPRAFAPLHSLDRAAPDTLPRDSRQD